MLNFNYQSHNTTCSNISEKINKLMDAKLLKIYKDEPMRNFLGASRLGGVSCLKALQYEYIEANNGGINLNDTAAMRIFSTGEYMKELIVYWVYHAGFEVDTFDEKGKEFGFEVADGKIAGHIDGVITSAPPELNLTCPMLWEAKTMNSKNWKETVKKGLVSFKPLYAAQISLYQAYMEESITGISKNPCLFTAYNKDTSELYHELIPFDAELAQKMNNKAVNIVKATEAGEPLPRHYSRPDVFECKMCLYSSKCWNKDKITTI